MVHNFTTKSVKPENSQEIICKSNWRSLSELFSQWHLITKMNSWEWNLQSSKVDATCEKKTPRFSPHSKYNSKAVYWYFIVLEFCGRELGVYKRSIFQKSEAGREWLSNIYSVYLKAYLKCEEEGVKENLWTWGKLALRKLQHQY